MIKNVVFDLGRVMYNYWPREYLNDLGYDEARADRLMECIFDNPLWMEIDRGFYTVPEYADKICADFPAEAEDIRRVLSKDWVDRVLTLMPPSLEFFYDVKRRGYNTYILSNFGEDDFAHIRVRDAFFFEQVDGMVISSHEKVIKPDPAIYFCLLNRYGLVPEETLFIDDNERNIGAARALGIHGIVFTGIDDCKARFELIVSQN